MAAKKSAESNVCEGPALERDKELETEQNAKKTLDWDRVLLIAVIAAVVVIAAIALILLMQPAGPGNIDPNAGGSGINASGTTGSNATLRGGGTVANASTANVSKGNAGANSVPLASLVPGMATAIKGIKKAAFDFTIGAAVFAGDDPSQSMGGSVEGKIKYNIDEKTMYGAFTTTTAPGEEGIIETYVVGNTSYIKISESSGKGYWVKQEVSGGVEDMVKTDVIGEIIATLDGEVVGTEKINGRDTKKIRVEPDIGDIVNAVLESQASEMAGLEFSRTDIDKTVRLIEDSIKKLELYVWVDGDLPVKLEGEAVLELDMGAMYGSPGLGEPIVVSADFTIEGDYSSPVIIDLPAEALNATDLTRLYGL